MFFRYRNRIAAGLIAAACSAGAFAADFTQADLEQMVRELEAVCTKNAAYKWPIKCSIQNNRQVNAYASYEDPQPGQPPQAIMVVYTGLIQAANHDKRLLRAVVAHEVAHLALGHVDNRAFRARELELMMTRQQEYAADSHGAALLQRCGYSKNDVVDMLLFLENRRKRGQDGWLFRANGDHAEPKERAARITDNPTVLKSLVQFDIGLAYMECRKYKIASDMFEVAVGIEPRLKEAWTNRALSRLLFYWSELPKERQLSIFRPDFGPFITTPYVRHGMGGEVTDQNRAMWRDAVAAIQEAIDKSATPRDAELLALAKILEPDGKLDVIREGIEALKKMTPANGVDAMRYANNVGVGLVLSGDVNGAYGTILSAWKAGQSDNAAAAENLGRINVPAGSRSKDDLRLSRSIFRAWLENTPKASPAYNVVYKSYEDACRELGETPEKLEELPNYLTPALSLNHKGQDAGTLVGLDKFIQAFGKAELLVRLSKDYPDLFELRWEGGKFSLVAEANKALKVTSYVPGDFLTIKPVDPTVLREYKVEVGMAKSDLVKWCNLAAAKERELMGMDGLEKWQIMEALNFAVLIENDKVKGISVTTIAPEEE